MSCTWAEEHLNEWVDEELSTVQRRRLEAHLAACPACRAEADALKSLSRRAAALPLSLEPRRDLWPGLAARLEAAGRGTGEPSAITRGRAGNEEAWSPWRSTGRWAALLLVALAGGLLWALLSSFPSSPPPEEAAAPTSAPGGELEALVSQTRLTVEREARHQDTLRGGPAPPGVVEEQLRILDAAVREIRAAIDEDPQNLWLQRALVATYRKQLELLRYAVSLPKQDPGTANTVDTHHLATRSRNDEIA